MNSHRLSLIAAFSALCLGGTPAIEAQEAPYTDVGVLDEESAERLFPAKPDYSPWVGRDFPSRPFFGDTHLHTALSFDAGMIGGKLMPSDKR